MTSKVRGLPSGRAGRMWLGRRLAVAARGGDLLEQKLRILTAEEQSIGLRAERTLATWDAALRDLELWTLRASLLSGERALRLACDGADVEVVVEWRLTMGVRFPASAACRLPERAPSDPVPDNAALLQAVDASRRTVGAAVDHAVAAAALAAVRAEIASTRRQLRAVRERWIPRLESASTRLTAALDDQEHDEAVRLRWAADSTGERTVRR